MMNCEHGVYLGKGCTYCPRARELENSSQEYGFKNGLHMARKAIEESVSLKEALEKIDSIKWLA